MNRRVFIREAGLLVLGSGIAGTFCGCSDVTYTYIPCLGPAAAPVPVPGMTYVRASEIGCALDCNLNDGSNKYHGGRATDDAPRINAAMAGATAEHPITLIIDGSALISGLFLPAGGHWSIAGLGCGTGFFIKSGTNNDGIHNGPPGAALPFDPGPPAPPRGQNVSLSNFTLNGNQGNGRNGVSTSGLARGNDHGLFCSIDLMNLDHIRVENVVVVNSPAFHFRFSNVGDVVVKGCVVQSKGLATDGLHFDGPANDISIANCTFTTGDDAIALNCPEGYSGDISRVTVENCTFNSWSLMRLYTTLGGDLKYRIESVSVSHCSGTFMEGAFLIGLAAGSLPDSVASLTVTDCALTAPAVLAMAENFGAIQLKNVTFTPSHSGTVWNKPVTNRICAFLRPSPLYGGGSCVGSALALANCQIVRTKDDLPVAGIVLENNSSIERLAFDGMSIRDRLGPIPNWLVLGSQGIRGLVIDALDSDKIEAPVSVEGFPKIGLVSGAGVLSTGWKFPDSVMADEVPYISMESGVPTIKLDGVAEPYAGP